MSSGIKQLVQYAPETVVGTTPSPFARTTLPFTTTSLDAAPTTTESNTIKDSRIASGTYVTGIDYTGTLRLSCNMVHTTLYLKQRHTMLLPGMYSLSVVQHEKHSLFCVVSQT